MLVIMLALVAAVMLVLQNTAQHQKESTNHKYLDQTEVDTLYRLLATVDACFDHNKLPYITIGGTLLGQVRHGGLIPWDDDADIAVFDEAALFSARVRLDLAARGVILKKTETCPKLFFANSPRHTDYPWNFPFVDVFVLQKTAPGKWEYADADQRDQWPDVYLDHELFPITRRPFGPLRLPCPARPIPLLKRSYGDDCLTMFYEQYNHKLEEEREDTEVYQLTTAHKKPALPSPNFMLTHAWAEKKSWCKTCLNYL